MRRAVLAVFAVLLLSPWHAMAAEAAHEAESGGVPQLETASYPSQIFWLLVSGILLYVLMAKVALPRIARMVEMRDDKVRRDLESASRLRQEAEDIKVLYMRTLRDADERARTMVDRVTREIKDKQGAQIAAAMERVNRTIADTEQRLHNDVDNLLKDKAGIAGKLSGLIIQELAKTGTMARS